MTHYDGRHTDLKNRINKHLKKLTGQDLDFYSGMTQGDLSELKTVLADINNVLTFKTTITAANWLCNLFGLDQKQRKIFLKQLTK